MEKNKEKMIISLKKARGNIEHIEKMIQEGGECFAVIQQMLATIGLLQGTQEKMLEEHVEKTLAKAFPKTSSRTLSSLKEEITKVVRSSRK